MGDEQGGSYHPQALLAFDAVDVNRVDATTNGGITRLRAIVASASRSTATTIAPHMYPHIHRQVLGALGYTDVPDRVGRPGHRRPPDGRPLVQPTVRDGLMDPLPDLPGLGALVDPAWIAAQDEVTDPDGLLADL